MRTVFVWFVLIVLAAWFGVRYWEHSKQTDEQSVSLNLMTLSPEQLTHFRVHPRGTQGKGLYFVKKQEDWLVSNGQQSAEVSNKEIDKMLAAFVQLDASAFLGSGQKIWTQYGLTNTGATQVDLSENTSVKPFLLATQQTTDSTSYYFRFVGENEVYRLADDFQLLPFKRRLSDYRSRTLFELPKGDYLQALLYQKGNQNFNFHQVNQVWMQPDSTSLLPDGFINDYLNQLLKLEGQNFADDFDEVELGLEPVRRLAFLWKNMSEPHWINLYLDSTSQDTPFILETSKQAGTFFASDTAGLYHRLFYPLDTLLGDQYN